MNHYLFTIFADTQDESVREAFKTFSKYSSEFNLPDDYRKPDAKVKLRFPYNPENMPEIQKLHRWINQVITDHKLNDKIQVSDIIYESAVKDLQTHKT